MNTERQQLNAAQAAHDADVARHLANRQARLADAAAQDEVRAQSDARYRAHYQAAAIALANAYEQTSDPAALRPFLDEFRAARLTWEAAR